MQVLREIRKTIYDDFIASSYKILLYMTRLYLYFRYDTNTKKVTYKTKSKLNDKEYHHYYIDGKEFVICDNGNNYGNDSDGFDDIHSILNEKSKVLYSSLTIRGIEYDITTDIKKFALYFTKAKRSIEWSNVLEYCFSKYNKPGLFDEGSELTILYNDDDMTEFVIYTKSVQFTDFFI